MSDIPVLQDTPKDCLSNLHICKASCCKILPFDLKVPLGHPLEDYYRKRGLEVHRLNRLMIKVFVPNRCAQLTLDNLCSLHGTPAKPKLCLALNEKTAYDKIFHITEGCIYGKD